MSKVSVIIPCRNVAWCIKDQLQALANQNYQEDWEIIIVNNKSSDNSKEVIQQIQKTFPVSITIIDALNKDGAAYALNVGAKNANSTFLAFCDADDKVNETWLKALVSFCKDGTITSGASRRWDGKESNLKSKILNTAEFKHLCGPPMALNGNMCITKNDFLKSGGFDEDMITGEDAEFSWRFLKNGGKIFPVNVAVIDYRYRANLKSTFKQYVAFGIDDIKLLLKFKNDFKYDYSAPNSPKRTLPFVALFNYLKCLFGKNTILKHHYISVIGKRCGHLLGMIKYRYFLWR
jgi:glycosyltransferase involved in cell wall biosynthesis